MLNQDLPGSLGASVMAHDCAARTTAAELGETHVLGSVKLPRSCPWPSPCDRRVILSLACEKGVCTESSAGLVLRDPVLILISTT